MAMKQQLNAPDLRREHSYAILEPVFQLLLKNGEELITGYHRGSNPVGYFCLRKYPVSFELTGRSESSPTISPGICLRSTNRDQR